MYNILIIEDDMTITSAVHHTLNKWGYNVLSVTDFADIMPEFTTFQPNLLLLDINLPYYDGFYWCAQIRRLSNIPIIFISSRDSDGDKIRAISQGGDDFIEKPFSVDLLVAKVQAVLRRAYSYTDHALNVLQHRELILDVEKLRAYRGDDEVELTKNEGMILAFLMRNQGKTVSRSRIIKKLWDDASFVDDNTLTVNVNRLRRKLQCIELDGYIKTVKGEGYCLS